MKILLSGWRTGADIEVKRGQKLSVGIFPSLSFHRQLYFAEHCIFLSRAMVLRHAGGAESYAGGARSYAGVIFCATGVTFGAAGVPQNYRTTEGNAVLSEIKLSVERYARKSFH